MNMILSDLAMLLVAALGVLVAYRSRLPVRALGEVLGGVLGWGLAVALAVMLGGVLNRVLSGVLGEALGGVLGWVLGGVLGAVLIGVLRWVLDWVLSVWRKRRANVTEAPDDRRPPLLAEYLLYVFLTKKEREPLLGDLEEEYHTVAARFGKRRAHFCYYAQVVRSLWPLAVRVVKKLIKWGVLGWIGDLVRRVIS